jgi:carboxylesterase
LVVIVPAVVGAVALLGLAGRWYRRSLATKIMQRFERSQDGIIRGAEPIRVQGSTGCGVLLVHGGGDTPQTMAHLAAAFHSLGYTVSAPLLPGHGRDLGAFDADHADAWYDVVMKEFRDLAAAHEWVGVVGLSMGGALCARLAAGNPRVGALVLASPYLSMPPVGELAARTSPLWGVLFPAIATASSRSVLDPAARAVSLGYGAFTHRTLRALRLTAARGREALSKITAPTLVMQSTTDNRISTKATQAAFEAIGAREKEIDWIEGAGHVITVDFGWQRVVTRSVEWIESHRTKTTTGRRKGVPSVRSR